MSLKNNGEKASAASFLTANSRDVGHKMYLPLSSPSAPAFWKLDRNIFHTPWALGDKNDHCKFGNHIAQCS